ncbi:MAG: hypothetical protein CMA43_03890 [Euryarchaeota archaeon]|jgi:hypothetical protein|nr:hypothetical protein [Euryarchaeota archaeon]MBC94627.1 hypothetical protein [Euryarchaeota archaeon]|tara:strand:- start:1503 stop:1694 length:192 start_codon:yes stop_codon:yes gene_type:complete
MKKEDEKLLAIAIVAVLSSISEGEIIASSSSRDRGDSWSMDHRRVLIGRRNLFRAKSRRSTTR